MLLLLTLLACDDQIFTSGAGHSASSDGGAAESILAESCGSCHASSLKPTLSEKLCENTVDVMATQVDMPFITAGDPENSYLLHKLKGTAGSVGGVASVMPPTGALSEADIQAVEDWIVAGASCSGTVTEDTGVGEPAGEPSNEPEDTGNPNMDQSIPEGADVQNGTDLFNTYCAYCHINGYAPDLGERVPMIDNDQILSTIKNGSASGQMDPVSDLSDASDLNDVLAYLRTTYPSNSGQPMDLAEGEALVSQHCSSCHPAVKPFSDIIPQMSAQEISDIIKDGNSSVGMPAFGDQLTGQEIDTIVYYLTATFNNN